MESNGFKILQAFDSALKSPCEICIYGRAALSLGYTSHRLEHDRSLDVDLILTTVQSKGLQKDFDFWDALDATNRQLAPSGLYVTHLFEESQVILLPDWYKTRVPLKLPFRKLKPFRLDGINLLLSKMMRDDPEDMKDIQYILSEEKFKVSKLKKAFAHARLPNVPEIKLIFDKLVPKVLKAAETL